MVLEHHKLHCWDVDIILVFHISFSSVVVSVEEKLLAESADVSDSPGVLPCPVYGVLVGSTR